MAVFAGSLTGPVLAACKSDVSLSRVRDFNDHPRRYVSRYPKGGAELVFSARAFAAADRVSLRTLATVMRTMTVAQKRSVGQGMAEAVIACLPRDGEVARQIADVLKQAADPDLTDAYIKASGDDPDPVQAAGVDDDARRQQSLPVAAGQELAIRPFEAGSLPASPGGLLSPPRVQ